MGNKRNTTNAKKRPQGMKKKSLGIGHILSILDSDWLIHFSSFVKVIIVNLS